MSVIPAVWPSRPYHYDVSEAKISGNHVQQDSKIISLYNNILIYYTNYYTSMIETVKPGYLGLRDTHMACGMIPCLFYVAGNVQNRFTDHVNFDGGAFLMGCDHAFAVDRCPICQDDLYALVCTKCGLPEELGEFQMTASDDKPCRTGHWRASC